MNRRHILQALVSAPCLAGAGPLAVGAASAGPVAHPLSDQLTLLTGAGGNIVLHRGDSGLTLIDSGHHDHTDALLALIDELASDAPVRTLFNTHWHADHTGGNDALHQLGASIHAHENTRLWLGADFDVHWRKQQHRPRPAAALPDTTFYHDGRLQLDGDSLAWQHYPQAHTDGDITVRFATSKVLVCGGLLSDGHYPICDIATGGWIGGLVDANALMLERIDDDTLLIPDRGPPRRKADLVAQHSMLTDLYTKMKALAQAGHSGQDMLDVKVTADYDAVWGDPTEFVLETYRGMWAHTYDMGGFI